MRKSGFLPALLCIMLVLAGCRSIPAPGVGSGTVSLPETFSAQTDIRYGSLSLKGTYQRSVTGEASLLISSPESLRGLKLSVSEGSTQLSYNTLSFSVGSQVQPNESVMQILSASFNSLNGVSFRRPHGNGPFQLELQNELGQIKAIVSGAEKNAPQSLNFVPTRITIDALAFDASFNAPAPPT